MNRIETVLYHKYTFLLSSLTLASLFVLNNLTAVKDTRLVVNHYLGPIMSEYTGNFGLGAGLALFCEILDMQKRHFLAKSMFTVGLIALFANETIGIGGFTPVLMDIPFGLLGIVNMLHFMNYIKRNLPSHF